MNLQQKLQLVVVPKFCKTYMKALVLDSPSNKVAGLQPATLL